MRPKISVILATVRPDYPMLERPDTFIFEPTLRSLAAQTFRDFEVIIVDGLQGRRTPDPIQGEGGELQDQIIHAPQLALWVSFSVSHSPWYQAGYLAISAPKNEAIRHCNAPLVVSLDDCSEFAPDFLAVIWKLWRQRILGTALVEHRRGNVQTDHDPREHWIRGRQAVVMQAAGYTAFPLSAALEVNGYDEGYDGAKTLEDVDFSRRLQMLGYRFALHRDLRVIEHEHGDVAPEAFPGPGNVARGDRSIKCNAVHQRISENRGTYRANEMPYTDEEWALFGPPCGLYQGVGRCAISPYPCNWLRVPGDPDGGSWIGADPNWEHVRDWLPIFDLCEQWKARRREQGLSEEVPT